MTDSIQLKKQAPEFAKAKKYSDAAEIFERIWATDKDVFNEYECRQYVFCLQRIKNYQQSLLRCRALIEKYPGSSGLKSALAWSLFFTEIKKERIEDENRFLKAAKEITELCPPHDEHTPYAITLFKVLEYLNSRPNYPALKIMEWLQMPEG